MSAKSGAKKGKTSTYFKGVKAEMKKSYMAYKKKELVNYTGVVVLISAMVGIIVWLLDMGIHRLLSLIIK